MFWKESKGLQSIPLSSKVGISILLVVAGIGYLLGFANIYLTYAPTDQQPGMSVQDIRIAFYGARGVTRLEKSIDGSMGQYFSDEAGYQTTKQWLAAGAPESEFPAIRAIFDTDCNTCHSAEAAVADVVTVEYSDLRRYLVQDRGKPVPRLVSISHTHVLGTLPVIFLLVFIFSFTLYPEWIKTVVIGFSSLAIVLDVGTWWLAKLSGALAPLVILGGVSLAVSFAALILLSLYELWLKKS